MRVTFWSLVGFFIMIVFTRVDPDAEYYLYAIAGCVIGSAHLDWMFDDKNEELP